MPIEVIYHDKRAYPLFQSQGFASQYAFPFAFQICKGVGFDIGCNRLEWALPDGEGRKVYPIDPVINGNVYDADKLPEHIAPDFIFSSHCLEHVPDWVTTLNYWHERLVPGGVIFLYLPDFSQTYWRPWYNRKHRHVFTQEILHAYFADRPAVWKRSFVSGRDLNNSLIVIAEKA